MSEPLSHAPGLRRPLVICFCMLSLAIGAGILMIGWLNGQAIAFPDPRLFHNAFFVTTAAVEPAGLWLTLGFMLWSGLWLARGKQEFPARFATVFFSAKHSIAALAIISFLISTAGVWLVMHDHALAADENMANFQSQIFLAGKIEQPIPAALQPLAFTFKPLLAVLSADETRWTQGYLPIYALLRTPFLAIRLPELLNPLLTVLTVFGVAGICRILWPEKPRLAVVGAALTALSPQVLLTSMTALSMPAHLALNVLWLWCFLRPSSRCFWVAPVIGVLATGLHSPFVHALFVMPFLIRLLRDRRWLAAGWYAAVYLVGCVGFWLWWHRYAPGNVGSAAALFSWSNPGHAEAQAVSFFNLISWAALPAPLLACLAFWKWKNRAHSASGILADAAWSCLLTFGFYAMISLDQGFGWGNRYFHGVLGCLILLCVAGFDSLEKIIGEQRSQGWLALGLIGTLFLQIPLRCWQAERFVRPFATASEAFQKMDVDLVIYDPRMAWYSTELRRNNPTLSNRPLIANLMVLNDEDSARLKARFPKRRFVSKSELSAFGLSTARWSAEP